MALIYRSLVFLITISCGVFLLSDGVVIQNILISLTIFPEGSDQIMTLASEKTYIYYPCVILAVLAAQIVLLKAADRWDVYEGDLNITATLTVILLIIGFNLGEFGALGLEYAIRTSLILLLIFWSARIGFDIYFELKMEHLRYLDQEIRFIDSSSLQILNILEKRQQRASALLDQATQLNIDREKLQRIEQMAEDEGNRLYKRIKEQGTVIHRIYNCIGNRSARRSNKTPRFNLKKKTTNSFNQIKKLHAEFEDLLKESDDLKGYLNKAHQELSEEKSNREEEFQTELFQMQIELQAKSKQALEDYRYQKKAMYEAELDTRLREFMGFILEKEKELESMRLEIEKLRNARKRVDEQRLKNLVNLVEED